jgi:flagellar assembly protein FliH
MTATRFSFDTDFRGPNPGRRITDVDVAGAREQGFQDGFAQGREQAMAEQNAALTHMAGVIAQQAQALLAAQDQRLAEVETAAAQLAVVIARRIAGAALADKPNAVIEQAARECIVHARAAPHLAVRVNEAHVPDTERLFGRLAHESGYTGKVIILGEPEIMPGDARLEWADGGVVIERGALDAAIADAACRILGFHPDTLIS